MVLYLSSMAALHQISRMKIILLLFAIRQRQSDQRLTAGATPQVKRIHKHLL